MALAVWDWLNFIMLWLQAEAMGCSNLSNVAVQQRHYIQEAAVAGLANGWHQKSMEA